MVRAVFRTIKRFVARHTGIVRMYHEHMRMQNSMDALNAQVNECLSQLREVALATQRRADQQTTVLSALAELSGRMFEEQLDAKARYPEIQYSLGEIHRLVERGEHLSAEVGKFEANAKVGAHPAEYPRGPVQELGGTNGEVGRARPAA
ncbi:MAG TPA: hypothetical protein VK395_14780 [Gemmataceae bacterium]|nr:hypothetical protein [Gemmataceae bacterium]